MKTVTLEILKGARALLARPGAWTKKAFARDSLGYEDSVGSLSAVSFCLLGAVWKTGAGSGSYLRMAEDALRNQLEAQGQKLMLGHWNDEQKTVEPILDLLDQTILRCSQPET